MAYVARDQTVEFNEDPEFCTSLETVHLEEVFKGLSENGIYQSQSRTLPAQSELFRAGDPCRAVYVLMDGWIALYDLFVDGRKQILKFAIPGALLAFLPLPGNVFNFSAQALTDIVVRTMPRDQFIRLCKDHAQLGLQLALLISQDRDLAYDHLATIGRRPAQARVAHLLLELFVRCRLRWPGYRIEEMYLPLTQEDIGDATGLTGVHVNRVLQKLRRDRILEFHYHKLQILDPDALFDVAGIDANNPVSWVPGGSRTASANSIESSMTIPTKRQRGA